MGWVPEMFASLARTSKHPDAAEVASGLLNGIIEPETIDAVDTWVRQCYHRPRHSELVMCALNSVLDCCGVEAIRIEGAHIDAYHGDIVASYLNTGDTYTQTIVLDTDGEYHLTSYGDWLESYEQQETTDE